MTFKKGDKVNLGKKRPRAGRKRNELTTVTLSNEVSKKLKQMKKQFRMINKKQFRNMDDVVNHIIILANKYAHGIR